MRWVAGFDFPTLEQDYEFVALRHPDEYPFNEGRLVSSAGLDIGIEDYERAVPRGPRPAQQRPALASRHRCAVSCRADGPLQPQLRPAHPLLSRGGVGGRPGAGMPQPVPEHRGARRRDALRLRRGAAHRPRLPVAGPPGGGGPPASRGGPRLHRGAARDRCTTATRSTTRGRSSRPRSSPPTSQNQRMIESDLRRFVGTHLDLPDD